MTRHPFNVRNHRIATHNNVPHDLSVERKRRYIESRFRPEAFGEPARREDLGRYFMERGELQGELFE